ncbi:EndoU domain-containing protein [Amycolatopsis sp. NPDC051372]|uniref:EndoU domain-containing protein n=1 Tax=Amycolatopsis sp. NPDC051372 TaxID=3155669 RepID=UPI0034209CDB
MNELVLLENRYETWPRHVVPQRAFWSVLRGFRAFLATTVHTPALARPADYPVVLRMTTERQPGSGGKPVFINHTYFPADWTVDEVRQAGDGAWRSEEALRDEKTGAWSGVWRGLELAGYYNVGTGEVLTYFPVISP